ncbi:MAG: energy transducer TonB [Tenacibaculum sp.]
MKVFFKIIVFVFFALVSKTVKAQKEVCLSPVEGLTDVNSITKCAIEEKEDSKKNKSQQIKVNISVKRIHARMKRKSNAKALKSDIHSATIDKNLITNQEESLSVISKSPVSKRNQLNSIKAKLSKEAVRKAVKLNQVSSYPVFEVCENIKRKELKKCFNTEMIKHINTYFRYPAKAVRENIQGQIWVRFIIDKNGYVSNIKAIGQEGTEILNEEAERVVTYLPKFKPAKKKGNKVAVKYGFPINFSLED